jgi:hypothetical protein
MSKEALPPAAPFAIADVEKLTRPEVVRFEILPILKDG